MWLDLFTADSAVRDFGAAYLNMVGGFYGLFGLGLALFFASQGAGRMVWPLAGSAARLVVIAVGGWLDSARVALARGRILRGGRGKSRRVRAADRRGDLARSLGRVTRVA